MRRQSAFLSLVVGFVTTFAMCRAQSAEQRVEIQRRGETVVLEPYAPNILRVISFTGETRAGPSPLP
jgi:hypothetical protein